MSIENNPEQQPAHEIPVDPVERQSISVLDQFEAENQFEAPVLLQEFENLRATLSPKTQELLDIFEQRTEDLPSVGGKAGKSRTEVNHFEEFAIHCMRHPDRDEAIALLELTEQYSHPVTGEEILLIPVKSAYYDKVGIVRCTDTTYWTNPERVKPDKYGNLPETIPFSIDGSNYLMDTTGAAEEKISRDGAGEKIIVEEEGSIKDDLKNGRYGEALSKLGKKIVNLFMGKEKSKKDIPLDEFYNLGPLLTEAPNLSQEELGKRIAKMEEKIEATNDRQTKIRLTRCLGILKDNLDGNKEEGGLTRMEEELEIGDALLINKGNDQSSGISGWLGETLLESYEPGYGFTHIAIVSSINPVKISHSTGRGFVTDQLSTYAAATPFEGMVLKPSCDQARREAMAKRANEIVTAEGYNPETYNSMSAALDTVGMTTVSNFISKGKLNCGQFVAKVMMESGPSHAASLSGEPIPNDFIDKVEDLFTPTYACSVSN